jgi:hypothetical protein
MYDADHFFVPNALDRYTLSSRHRFEPNPDGSLDFYIQKDSPGKTKAGQLAVGAARQVRTDAASLLAEAVDARRLLGDPGRQASRSRE